MALTYIGPEGKFYPVVTVQGNFRTSLSPIPGETYHIDDPGDGNWQPEDASKVVVADTTPVLPDTTKTPENEPTAPVEQESD